MAPPPDVSAPLILIGAGGTAGHVVPALAVADALRAEGARVAFVGGERAERELVPAAGYELHTIRVAQLARRDPVRAARAVAAAGSAVVSVRRLIGGLGPAAVLGAGGYVAGPVGLAAVTRRVPLPFISYAPTNLCIMLASVGVLLNISRPGARRLKVVEGQPASSAADRERRRQARRQRRVDPGKRRSAG